MFRKHIPPSSDFPIYLNPPADAKPVIEWVNSSSPKIPKNSLKILAESGSVIDHEYITRENQSCPWKIGPMTIRRLRKTNNLNLQFLVAKEHQVIWREIEEKTKLPIDAYLITDGPLVGTNTFVGHHPNVGVGQIVVQHGSLKFYSENDFFHNPPFKILCYNWYETYKLDL